MLFHEIYGCYYESVARIIDQAIKGTLNEENHAFHHSGNSLL